MGPGTRLAEWYAAHGRHDLPWRASRDRWEVLVSEVMLAQTQVRRVLDAWPRFLHRFPTPAVAARAEPGDLIGAWERLGYPRRARRLWEAAVIVHESGWPDDLRVLPGVGRYTAHAIAAQVDDADTVGVDTNIRRVLQRTSGRLLRDPEAEDTARVLAAPLSGRDRLLALMDLGATVCTPRAPECGPCPLRATCTTRGPLPGEQPRRQAPYAGSMRERRGRVLAALREHGVVDAAGLDAEALAGLVADGLVAVHDGAAMLARR